METILNGYFLDLQVFKITYIFFSTFRDSLFARSQSLIWPSSWFAVSNTALMSLSDQSRFASEKPVNWKFGYVV